LPYIRLLLFIFFDLLVLSAIFLLFSYYGMSHVFLLLLAVMVLVLGYYDITTGHFSALLVMLFGLPLESGGKKFKPVNFLPLVVAVGFIWYSISSIREHGLVNELQKRSIQDGDFWFFIICILLLSLVMALASILLYIRENRK